MKITYYRNKRNENKYIEVHDDGHSHNTVRQFMLWKYRKWNSVQSITKNFTGDGHLHRWRKDNLKALLEDYIPIDTSELNKIVIFK